MPITVDNGCEDGAAASLQGSRDLLYPNSEVLWVVAGSELGTVTSRSAGSLDYALRTEYSTTTKLVPITTRTGTEYVQIN